LRRRKFWREAGDLFGALYGLSTDAKVAGGLAFASPLATTSCGNLRNLRKFILLLDQPVSSQSFGQLTQRTPNPFAVGNVTAVCLSHRSQERPCCRCGRIAGSLKLRDHSALLFDAALGHFNISLGVMQRFKQ
jgi:hypothetical protein